MKPEVGDNYLCWIPVEKAAEAFYLNHLDHFPESPDKEKIKKEFIFAFIAGADWMIEQFHDDFSEKIENLLDRLKEKHHRRCVKQSRALYHPKTS